MISGRRRRARLVGASATLAAVVTCTWFLAAKAETPADRDRASGPPKPSTITVPVVTKRITETEQLTCSVAPRQHKTLTVAAPATAGDSIVTDLPLKPGATVSEGDVVIEISGRPVIAIEGRLPAYRDLTLGATGPDVDQLEQALNRMGLLPSSAVGGQLDEATAARVRALYQHAGYDATDKAGPVVPREEVVSVPHLPGVLRIQGLHIGSAPTDGSLSIGPAGDLVRCDVPAERAEEFAHALRFRVQGSKVALKYLAEETTTEQDNPGTDPGQGIGDDAGQGTGLGPPHGTAIVLDPGRAHLDTTDVTVEALLRRADHEGLVVPLTALWVNSDGSCVVTVRRNGTNQPVSVQVTFRGSVEAQVTPTTEGSLTAGDRVLVGRNANR